MMYDHKEENKNHSQNHSHNHTLHSTRDCLPNPQLIPLYPTGQLQLYDLIVSAQVPLFWQGCWSHSFMSEKLNAGWWKNWKKYALNDTITYITHLIHSWFHHTQTSNCNYIIQQCLCMNHCFDTVVGHIHLCLKNWMLDDGRIEKNML